MLRVFKASGEEALAIQHERLEETLKIHPATVLALKRHLQPVCGHSRFKQRLLLQDAQPLSDDTVLDGPMDIQLILQPFEDSSKPQIDELIEKAGADDIVALEQLLHRPQDPDLESASRPARPGYILPSRTALHVACRYGNLDAARLLLEANADKEKPTSFGHTPMHVASQRGHAQMVKLLLEAKADKDKDNHRGETPMFFAACDGRVEVVSLLLEAKADKDKATSQGQTPLSGALQNDRGPVVRLLREAQSGQSESREMNTTDSSTAKRLRSALAACKLPGRDDGAREGHPRPTDIVQRR